MPLLSRIFVRSALLHLTGGFTLGALLLSAKAGVMAPQVWLLLPAHVDALLIGWMLQLAMGVGYWVLPRRRALGRGRPAAAVAALVLLNVGSLMFQVAGAPAMGEWRATIIACGVAFQAAALASFAVHAWPRMTSFSRIDASAVAAGR